MINTWLIVTNKRQFDLVTDDPLFDAAFHLKDDEHITNVYKKEWPKK